MPNYAAGTFVPKNPKKYIGGNIRNIHYRSSWELPVMNFCDQNQNIVGWGSEVVSIPYRNPLKPPNRQWTMYVPDFLIIYIDKTGQKRCELMEVKPEQDMPGYLGRVNARTKEAQVVNAAKWQAALAYCAKRNWTFRVVSDKQLFAFQRKP